MIQSVQDVAELMNRVVRRETGGEAQVVVIRERAFVTPPEVVLTVETVEGERFNVTVQHEPRR